MILIKLSEKLELIIAIFEQCKSDILWYESRLKDEERKENNIGHEMEGITTEDGLPPKYERRAVLATQWQYTLIARRVAKDTIATNKPISDFIDSDIGKTAINKLKQILGEVRKIEKGLKDRTYYKRKTDVTPDDQDKIKRLNELINEWKKHVKT